MSAGARQLTPDSGLTAEFGAPIRHDLGRLHRGSLVGGRYQLQRVVDPSDKVWLASDSDGAQYALKTGPRQEIEREYEILAGLQHKHIVQALDCVSDSGRSFLVCEYLSGGDLVSLAGLPASSWLTAIASVIDALGCLHDRGLVHRDIKARNVMFDEANDARLIDFGSAVTAGSAWHRGGTTAVAVREDRGDCPVTFDDDVYALGVLLHEMVFGRPFGSSSQLQSESRSPAGGPLLALIDECLESPTIFDSPGLSGFASVIESLLEQRDISA